MKRTTKQRFIIGAVCLLAIVAVLAGPPEHLSHIGYLIGSAFGLLALGAVTTVDDITETTTPSDHKVRDVSQKLAERMPHRFPIDTIMRKLELEEPAKAEKIEWEEDDIIPRSASANGAVTGGSNTDDIVVQNGEAAIFREDDLIFLPDNSAAPRTVLRVTGVNDSTHTVSVAGLEGANVPALDDNEAVIRMSNAKAEKFTKSGSRTTMPEQFWNWVQRFDAVIEISMTRKATKNYTKPDWQRSRDRQLYDFRNNIENTLIAGTRSTQTKGGEKLHTMGGLLHFITTKSISYTASTFDEADLIDIARQVFAGNAGSNTRYWFCDPYMVQDIALVSVDKVRRSQVESKTLKIMVSRIETEFGNLVVVPHYGLSELGFSRFGLILDMAQVRRRPLRKMKAQRLKLEENGVDADGIQLKEECSLEVRYELTHAVVNGS